MGRQVHIARLALGRSPWELPERQEDGSFVLGPNTQEHNAQGYIQQFNDRGHPQNDSAATAERRMRRAQNEVLNVAGVVARDDDEETSEWQRMSEEQKIDMVDTENFLGIVALMADRLALFVITYPVRAFRARLLTFSSNSELVRYFALGTEDGTYSEWKAYASSCVAPMLAGSCQLIRRYVVDGNPEERIDMTGTRGTDKLHVTWKTELLRVVMSSALLYCELPLQALAALQALYLVPPTVIPAFGTSLIPFKPASYLRLNLNAENPGENVLKMTYAFLASPLVLALLQDYVYEHIHFGMHAVIRQLLIKPDNPDELSITVADGEPIYDAVIPGLVVQDDGVRRFGPKSCLDAMTIAFPTPFTLLKWCFEQGNGSAGRPPSNNVISRSVELNGHGLSDSSRFVHDHGHVETNLQDDTHVSDAFDPTVPLEVLLESTANVDRRPETPTQGISRAPSLLQITPRPVRRPTEDYQDLGALSAEEGPIPEQYRPLHVQAQQSDEGTFRVTLLSNLPADSLAWHISSLITTIILLPIEAAYLRATALAFLSSPATQISATEPVSLIRADVRGVWDWFGRPRSGPQGPMRCVAALLLSLGIEACTSSILWYSTTGVAIWLGHRHGWGKF